MSNEKSCLLLVSRSFFVIAQMIRHVDSKENACMPSFKMFLLVGNLKWWSGNWLKDTLNMIQVWLSYSRNHQLNNDLDGIGVLSDLAMVNPSSVDPLSPCWQFAFLSKISDEIKMKNLVIQLPFKSSRKYRAQPQCISETRSQTINPS